MHSLQTLVFLLFIIESLVDESLNLLVRGAGHLVLNGLSELISNSSLFLLFLFVVLVQLLRLVERRFVVGAQLLRLYQSLLALHLRICFYFALLIPMVRNLDRDVPVSIVFVSGVSSGFGVLFLDGNDLLVFEAEANVEEGLIVALLHHEVLVVAQVPLWLLGAQNVWVS